jgi:hypothetical protein
MSTWEALRLWILSYGPFPGSAAEIQKFAQTEMKPGLVLLNPRRLHEQRVVMYAAEAGAGRLEYAVPGGEGEGAACALFFAAGYVEDPRHTATWVKEVHEGSRLVFDGFAKIEAGKVILTGKCYWPRIKDITQAAFFGEDAEDADRDDAEVAVWPVVVTDITPILEKSKEV